MTIRPKEVDSYRNSSILHKQLKIVILLIVSVPQIVNAWGFYAHKAINRHAVYLLPDNSLFIFFKKNIDFLSDNAINADKRRYTQEDEACKHYIDLDSYACINQTVLPKYYSQAKIIFSEDTLKRHGILPWHIVVTQNRLTQAFQEKNIELILRYASDLGHYVGDANVPLHTTHNYDGQLTNQKGIHALWETRLPELFSNEYDFLIGKAEFVSDVQAMCWTKVMASNKCVDSVLKSELIASEHIKMEEKYSFLENTSGTIRVYSSKFATKYSESLNGQVERQMKSAIKMLADLWYTSWIEAGQPDLSSFVKIDNLEKKEAEKKVNSDRFLESHNNCTHEHVIENIRTLTTSIKQP